MHAMKTNPIWALVAVALLAGCAGVEHSHFPKASCKEKWVVLPMDNFTESPHAGQATERIAENILRSSGISEVSVYPAALADSLSEIGAASRRYEKALDWARERNARFAVTGSISEWRYKAGSDGEPAVGMTLRIVDVESGKTVWSGGGAKTGWYWNTVSGTAQKLVRQLLGCACTSK